MTTFQSPQYTDLQDGQISVIQETESLHLANLLSSWLNVSFVNEPGRE